MSQTRSLLRTRPQQERSVATRARILDAAVEALVAEGYAGATTTRIQELAQVSRGRLLHHFPSRDELLIAAVNHLATARFEGMMIGREWPSSHLDRIEAAVLTMWSTYQQPYFWASTELWLASRHNPRLAEVLLPNERMLRGVIKDAVRTFFGDELASRAQFSALIQLLLSSMRGAAISYALVPGRDFSTDMHLVAWRGLAASMLEVGERAAD